MPYHLTVSPDFSPEHISGWYVFNTWLQKSLNEHIHLELYDDFAAQRDAIRADKVDLIYANPFDASMLVREKGFVPIARPAEKRDEAVVVVSADSPIQCVEDLQPGLSLASTDDPDVHLMGMIMLEPADLNAGNVVLKECDSYVLVAKELIRGHCQVGFFLADAFDDLSGLVRNQLRPLVRSEIFVIHHALLAGPGLADRRLEIAKALIKMAEDGKGAGVLAGLGFKKWLPVDDEDMEFMIDLMDTLVA